MNKNGQAIMIGLLVLVMTTAILIAVIPMMKNMLDITKQSDSLNCEGYRHNGDVNHHLSYNASLNSDTTACIAIGLYLPYLVLVVIIAGVSRMIMGQLGGGGGQQSTYYGGY